MGACPASDRFALALAEGLTPKLLPAMVSITLSHRVKRMTGQGVLVRWLNAIEDLGQNPLDETWRGEIETLFAQRRADVLTVELTRPSF